MSAQKTADILSLHGEPLDPGAPPKEVIATLEDCLAAARRGEYRAISVVALLPNGHSQHEWWICEGGWFSMVGAIETAKTRIMDTLLGRGQPSAVLDDPA